MTVSEATGRRMTIGERLAGLVPTEIETPDEPGAGYKKSYLTEKGTVFTCAVCGRQVELRFDQTMTDWAYKRPVNTLYVHCCSWRCMQEYNKEHGPRRESFASKGRPWTPEEDRLICDLYYREHQSQRVIGLQLNPPRTGSAVGNRLIKIKDDYFDGIL